jgi:hypothetical protein
MVDRGWYEDGDYHDAVQQAERASRFGWAVIGGTIGVIGCAVLATAFIGVVAVFACFSVVAASHY